MSDSKKLQLDLVIRQLLKMVEILGWVRSDQISKKIYNVIRNLKVGEVSEPIKQGKIITFFKINEKKPSNQIMRLILII